MSMDIAVAFKKYVKNIKIVFATSLLFIFTMFLVNPLFSLSGGSINLTYELLNQDPLIIILTLIAFIAIIFAYTLFQTIIVFKMGREYDFDNKNSREIKRPFIELLKFNVSFFLLLFIALCILFDFGIINNIFVNIILFVITLLFWFIPQIIVIEKQSAEYSIVLNINYIKKKPVYFVYLFVTVFILTLLTYIIDVIFGVFAGPIIATVFFVMFVIPFIEILKTEVYLGKYDLLKPFK
ncbi:MAG TPA: hypothetical protein PK655_01310 [archaeon]|nr:hypothetical protein [archaeon]HPV66071.1 hypothetical protein [archaeon]